MSPTGSRNIGIDVTRRLLNREAFMALFVVGLGGVVSVAIGIPLVGYLLGPLIQGAPQEWRDVGAVDKFKIGDTVQVNFEYGGPYGGPKWGGSASGQPLPWGGSTDLTAAWLRRTGPNTFLAFAVYCTHLGCPVHWFPQPKIFLCPCHGSVFNSDGTVAGGPAPRPLFTYQTRVNNGRVQILTQKLPVVV